MSAYYNEWEAYPAQWLRNLIAAGMIAPGDVDERSIADVKADDLKGYTQCHFFAGIGGWSYALRIAGWPDERPVWTGSCPCQPFSTAGKKSRQQDERHLWPHWSRLIGECLPPTIFGEQVANAITAGWADDVSHDLETKKYAFASAVLPACSIAAPHKRDRLWFVAHAEDMYDRGRSGEIRKEKCGSKPNLLSKPFGSGEKSEVLANSGCILDEFERKPGNGAEAPGEVQGQTQKQRLRTPTSNGGSVMADPQCRGLPGGDEQRGRQRAIIATDLGSDSRGHQYREARWAEPAVGRVAYGVPCDMGRLRGYGNAIVPQVAQAFIEAFMECRP